MFFQFLFVVSLFASSTNFCTNEHSDSSPVSSDSTALETSVQATDQTKVQEDKQFCMSTLSDDTADINGSSPSGRTVLQLLTLYYVNNFRTEQLMAYALQRGAQVNTQDGQGRTPLYFIVAYTACPQLFMSEQEVPSASPVDANQEKSGKQEDVNVHQHESSTDTDTQNPPVKKSSHERSLNLAVIELLLACGADATIADDQNISPLAIAILYQDQELLELFSRYGLLDQLFPEESSEDREQEDAAAESGENLLN